MEPYFYMKDKTEIKQQFIEARQAIFDDDELLKDPLNFSVRYSLLIEEFIFRIGKKAVKGFALASAGSFSRRELSPYSDIDLMFILPTVEGNEEAIQEVVTLFWDCGIEASHTVRELGDIEKYHDSDLHTFTQFFETRFILGNEKIYKEWNDKLLSSVREEKKGDLIRQYFGDIKTRHKKYGESAKVLEPNIKFSAGGLRDLQVVGWMYALKNNVVLTEQSEITQTESFLEFLKQNKQVHERETDRLLESYKFILGVRNALHLLSKHRTDRLEFGVQQKIARQLGYRRDAWKTFMRDYFDSANVIARFSKTMIRRFEEQITNPISDILTIPRDEDFTIKGNMVSINEYRILSLSEIFRAFYYRAVAAGRFDENLRSLVIESIQQLERSHKFERSSSVFFREILKLPRYVGDTLIAMNELGLLGAFLPEFKELVGFFQPGVYHCYTADEHTLIAVKNLEDLRNNNSNIGKLYSSIHRKDILYLAIIFHDIAKPISLSGHEIIGGEIATSVMERLGYQQEDINIVQFLVRHHLTMEQTAFRRNLNDPATLNNFRSMIPYSTWLDYLYLLTYADLSAVSPIVWTQWKNDLLYELYRKTHVMLDDRIIGEELLEASAAEIINGSPKLKSTMIRDHIDSIDDIGYLQQFTEEDINQHVNEIQSGEKVSILFKEEESYTNITVITRDAESLLSRLCGALSINDVNIHDAKIFTRKDKIVIDSFNVTDFRTGKVVENFRYEKIEEDIKAAVNQELQISKEFKRIQTKWRRLEDKLFKRKSKIKIDFEKHVKYTIIDVFSPDRLGLLYQVTKKMNELGLIIYMAKIGTKGDDVVDAFYILNEKGNKISPRDYELVRVELTNTIEEML